MLPQLHTTASAQPATAQSARLAAPPGMSRTGSVARSSVQSASRFFPHLGPAPTALSIDAIHGRQANSLRNAAAAADTAPLHASSATATGPGGRRGAAAPVPASPALTAATGPASSSTTKRLFGGHRKSQRKSGKLVGTATATPEVEDEVAHRGGGINSAGASPAPPPFPRSVSIEHADEKQPAEIASPRNLHTLARRTSLAGPVNAAGVGPPPHIRRVSVNPALVLESPRMRAAPSISSPIVIRQASVGGVAQGPVNLRKQTSVLRMSPSHAAKLAPGAKACGALHCELARVSGEGFCAAHLSDNRTGAKLQYKRSPSMLHRIMVRQVAPPPAVVQKPSGGHSQHHHAQQHSISQSGIGSVNAFSFMMAVTEGDEEREARAQEQRKRREAEHARNKAAAIAAQNRSTFVPERRSSKTLLKEVMSAAAASVAACNAPTPRSGPRTFLIPPLTLRQKSYGLPVESLPPPASAEDDVALGSLTFHRYHFQMPPPDFDTFIQWRDRVSVTPEGASVAFLMALLLWSEGQELSSGGVGWGSKKPAAHHSHALQRMMSDDGGEGDAASLAQSLHAAAAQQHRSSDALAAKAARRTASLLRKASTGRFDSSSDEDDEAEEAKKQPKAAVASAADHAAPSRLFSFHKAAPAARKVDLTSHRAAAGAPLTVAEASPHWKMPMRWRALISTIHPDQTIQAPSGGGGHAESDASLSSLPAGSAFHSRILCALDVDSLNDSFQRCPHLARSFVGGTTPKDGFQMPRSLPPVTPPLHNKKIEAAAKPNAAGIVDDAADPDPEEDPSEYRAALELLSAAHGNFVFRLARHPFASGTANHDLSGTPFALMLVHNSGLKYPKSLKLRKDASGRWRVTHWFNLLCQVPRD